MKLNRCCTLHDRKVSSHTRKGIPQIIVIMGEPIRDEPLNTTVTPAKRSLEIDDPFQPYKVERFDDGLRYDTLQVHAGHRPDRETHARAVPIYNSVVSGAVSNLHVKLLTVFYQVLYLHRQRPCKKGVCYGGCWLLLQQNFQRERSPRADCLVQRLTYSALANSRCF